jgi:LysR family glycine cleavage system transcriptional activator
VKGVDAKSSIKYPQADHAIQAAMDGTGVLFGRIAIAAFDLAAKRLVMPFDTVLPSPFGYFFVTRQGRTRERAVAAFLAWMQAQAVDLPPVVR